MIDPKFHNSLVHGDDDETLDEVVHYVPTLEVLTKSTSVQPDPQTTVEASKPKLHINPFTPVRTAEEQAVVDERKAAGLAPDGKKKKYKNPSYRRSRLTLKDAELIAFLAKFGRSTTDQLRTRLIIDNEKHASFGRPLSESSMNRRLYGLAEAGAIEKVNYLGYGRLWRATKLGATHAVLMGLIDDSEVDPAFRNETTLSELPHTLGVNQVAARLCSPFGFEKKTFGDLTISDLVPEWKIRSDWAIRINALRAAGTAEGVKQTFAEWRRDRVNEVLGGLNSGALDWRYAVEDNPEFWTIGLTTGALDLNKKHHHPDLVVNLESRRVDAKPVSVAIEVERSLKSASAYRSIIATWAAELRNPLRVYAKLIYYTNRDSVRNAVRRADKEFGLEKHGFLSFREILNPDGTVMDITGRA